jgi:hypothetical protein
MSPTRASIGKILAIVAACLLAVPLIVLGATSITRANKPPQATLTVYHYDKAREVWVRDVQTVDLVDGPEGAASGDSAASPAAPGPEGSNTVIIKLDHDNPVKQIVIFEALITGRGAFDPRLEIAGHDTGGSGRINIGTLLFKQVDAEKLKIDADVVRLQMQNVVAEDNELDIDIEAVNVVRTARGGPSTLFIGFRRADLDRILDRDLTSIADTVFPVNETGVRVDRIRILGPSSGTAFVERIIILRTSVLGQIEVRDVKIQDLILRDVTVDDST